MKAFFSNKNTYIAMALGAVLLFAILYATGKQSVIAKPVSTPTTTLPPAQ